LKLLIKAKLETIDFLEGKYVVGCKWIYNIKYKEDGSIIDRYNARFIPRVYSKREH
jgi:hypothetical protein